MRAFLLASVFPALALALTACGQPETSETAEAPPPPAPAAAAPETPAPPPPPPPPAAAAPAQQAAAAPAADDDPLLAAIALRQGAMKLVAFSNAPVGAMMRGTTPFDTAAVKVAADRLAVLAPMVPGVFATDTSASSGETEALPSIWANKADFDSKANDLLMAAQALSAAAATGDEAATRAAVAGIGEACSGCHDDYRE